MPLMPLMPRGRPRFEINHTELLRRLLGPRDRIYSGWYSTEMRGDFSMWLDLASPLQDHMAAANEGVVPDGVPPLKCDGWFHVTPPPTTAAAADPRIGTLANLALYYFV